VLPLQRPRPLGHTLPGLSPRQPGLPKRLGGPGHSSASGPDVSSNNILAKKSEEGRNRYCLLFQLTNGHGLLVALDTGTYCSTLKSETAPSHAESDTADPGGPVGENVHASPVIGNFPCQLEFHGKRANLVMKMVDSVISHKADGLTGHDVLRILGFQVDLANDKVRMGRLNLRLPAHLAHKHQIGHSDLGLAELGGKALRLARLSLTRVVPATTLRVKPVNSRSSAHSLPAQGQC
jgi:hypothetical protein